MYTLTPNEYGIPSEWSRVLKTTYVVDAMGQTRRVPTVQYKTFGHYMTAYLNSIYKLCVNANTIHLVFDSYIDGSVKDSERLRRSTKQAVEISTIENETLFPIDLDSFWPSSTNKEKLQLYIRNTILSDSQQFRQGQIVLSGVRTKDQQIPCMTGDAIEIDELNSDLEEADLRLILHILYAVKQGSKRIVVLSNDTDVLVLLLHFMEKFRKKGVQEIWQRAGTGNTIRYIPIHGISDIIGKKMCKVLPAAHILTGCDSTSKVGTKASCLKADPTKFLSRFGKQAMPSDDVLDSAEAYLVQVLQVGSPFNRMDQLRYYKYFHSKNIIYAELPPSTYSLRAHLLRCWYNCHVQLQCLGSSILDPLQYGYVDEDGIVSPLKRLRLVPLDLVLPCTCKKCATQRCACRKNCVSCCMYLGCRQQSYEQQGAFCKNPKIM